MLQLVEGCQDAAEALFDGLAIIRVRKDIKLVFLHRRQYPVCDGARSIPPRTSSATAEL
jgi:hypothetical protein